MTSPWQAFRCKAVLPLSPENRALVVTFLSDLAAILQATKGLHASLWLDTAQLHRDGGSRLFSSHARQWSPVMGFGFDPTGPAPRTLEFSDLADATFGTPPKIFDRSAIFISSLKTTKSAYGLLAGRGLATMMFFRQDAPGKPDIVQAIDRFMENSRRTLEPMIASSMFRNYPFYLPLLSSAGITRATPQQLEDWLTGADVVWRENYEDSELLLLSRLDLVPSLQAAGILARAANLEHEGPVRGWTLTPDEHPEILHEQ